MKAPCTSIVLSLSLLSAPVLALDTQITKAYKQLIASNLNQPVSWLSMNDCKAKGEQDDKMACSLLVAYSAQLDEDPEMAYGIISELSGKSSEYASVKINEALNIMAERGQSINPQEKMQQLMQQQGQVGNNPMAMVQQGLGNMKSAFEGREDNPQLELPQNVKFNPHNEAEVERYKKDMTARMEGFAGKAVIRMRQQSTNDPDAIRSQLAAAQMQGAFAGDMIAARMAQMSPEQRARMGQMLQGRIEDEMEKMEAQHRNKSDLSLNDPLDDFDSISGGELGQQTLATALPQRIKRLQKLYDEGDSDGAIELMSKLIIGTAKIYGVFYHSGSINPTYLQIANKMTPMQQAIRFATSRRSTVLSELNAIKPSNTDEKFVHEGLKLFAMLEQQNDADRAAALVDKFYQDFKGAPQLNSLYTEAMFFAATIPFRKVGSSPSNARRGDEQKIIAEQSMSKSQKESVVRLLKKSAIAASSSDTDKSIAKRAQMSYARACAIWDLEVDSQLPQEVTAYKSRLLQALARSNQEFNELSAMESGMGAASDRPVMFYAFNR